MEMIKRTLLLALGLMIVLSSFAVYANPMEPTVGKSNIESTDNGNQITIWNKSNQPVYVYDDDYGTPKATPTLTPNGLLPNQKLPIIMQKPANPNGPGRRIYISSQRLSSLEQNGTAPDGFCPWNNGAVMFSFAEYNYQPSDNCYTIDMSYIDEFSYPVTLTFANAPSSYSGCQNNFEYGFTSLSAVIQALKNQGAVWGDLVWNTSNTVNPASYLWPENIHRVIGPNKLWTSQSCGSMTTYAPDNYQTFVTTYPWNGTQLFGSQNNFNAWMSSTTLPANTGYVEALHSVAKPDIHGKYGFFTYCEDNANGEFTNVPIATQCTLAVYSFNS